MRVRGLKLHVGQTIDDLNMSHPMRVRGLKHGADEQVEAAIASHPMRVRGLKRQRLQSSIMRDRRTPCGCVD